MIHDDDRVPRIAARADGSVAPHDVPCGRFMLPWTTIAVFLVTATITGVAYLHPRIVQALARTQDVSVNHEWWRLLSPVLINPDGWLQVTCNFCVLAIAGTIAERAWGGHL